MKKAILAFAGVGVVPVCWLAVVGMTPPAPQNAMSQVDPVDAGIRGIAELTEYTLQTLELPAEVGAPFATSVTLDGESYLLVLTGKSLRADDFRLLVQWGDDETLTRVEPPAPRTYKGFVDGVADAWVAGSVLDDGLSLTIALPDGRRYEIAPLAFYFENAGPSAEHVVFRSRDTILPNIGACATDTSHAEDHSAELGGGEEGGVAGTSTKVIDVSFDTDAEFYQLNGSSVTNTLFDIENVMVRVENIYESEVNATYEVTTIIVRTNASTDPYNTTSSSTLLSQFDNHWSTTKSDVRRDVAHMMTGRNNLDGGGTLGIAQLNQTCNFTGAYALSASRFTTNMTLRACVTAHEIGHNFNASHCSANCSSGADCRIMCPCVNGCAQDCLNFGATEQSQINAKIASSSCLSNEVLPVAPPFFDDFPTGTISTTKWAYVDGVIATTGSVAPPSGTIALQINAAGNTEFGDDEIRTTFITLAGLPSATVSYFTQARGVEAGEELVVEYWAANLRWIELARYTATGVDENVFTQRVHVLTGSNALHNEFRLRFRAEVDQSNDNWYVDDVSVSASPIGLALNVESAPTDGAAILVAPNDQNGQAGGITPFTRSYANGAEVTLIAPATFNGNPFTHWTIDGASQPPGQTTIAVTMSAARTCVAHFPVPTLALEVSSLPNPGVSILISPPDQSGQAGGETPFTRNYVNGTVVLMQAPIEHNGNEFRRWVINGVDRPEFQTQVNFTMTANTTAEAIYVPPATEQTLTVSSLPAMGIDVQVSPLDNQGLGNGTTGFTRIYNGGELVTLTAPDHTATLTFRRWTVGGVDQPVDQLAVTFTLDSDLNAVAHYRVIGDANCDGTTDFFDIDAFLMSLFDPSGYAATFCDGSIDTVDCDGSGTVDFFDIDAFLEILF